MIGARRFDTGVTEMMGIRQGSQLAGIAQQMGGGTKAAGELAKGLLSIVNPTSLVTIGLTTLAAVGIQGIVALAAKSKSLEERINELKLAFDRYKASSDLAGASSLDLASKFGAGAAAAQGLYGILSNLDRLSVDQKLKATASAVRETVGTMKIDNLRGGNTFALAAGQAVVRSQFVADNRSYTLINGQLYGHFRADAFTGHPWPLNRERVIPGNHTTASSNGDRGAIAAMVVFADATHMIAEATAIHRALIQRFLP